MAHFAAFEIINYRWFFAALCGNFAAMNIQMFIRGWLVFEITASYEKLGWMTAAGGLVGLVAAPLAAWWRPGQKENHFTAGRNRQRPHHARYRGTIFQGILVFEHLLISSILQGLVMNAMMPARQAFTKDCWPRPAHQCHRAEHFWHEHCPLLLPV